MHQPDVETCQGPHNVGDVDGVHAADHKGNVGCRPTPEQRVVDVEVPTAIHCQSDVNGPCLLHAQAYLHCMHASVKGRKHACQVLMTVSHPSPAFVKGSTHLSFQGFGFKK